MKRCGRCGEMKAEAEFGVHRCMKDGLRAVCRACQVIANRESYLRNQVARQKEARKRTAEWRKLPGNAERNRRGALDWYRQDENGARARQRARDWSAAHRDEKRAADKAWRDANPGACRANVKRYKVSKRASVPVWANSFFIEQAYDIAVKRTAVTGFDWHVDHVVPLQGRTVCGLHVENNLLVIPATINLTKGNRHWPDMP